MKGTNMSYEEFILFDGKITEEELRIFKKQCNECISYDYYV